MLGWFKWKQTGAVFAGNDSTPSEPALAEHMVWCEGATLPIPDWSRIPWHENDSAAALNRQANSQAAAWLDAMASKVEGHARAESDNFMLSSALAPRPSRVLLDYLERSRRRVLATLPGIAQDRGYGKTVVLVFSDEETYYRYVAHYGADSSEPQAFSGGMFVDAGYGHFVFVQGSFETMEPVVVHELTHCLVGHLHIPAWLNEGLAVSTEHRFIPSRPRYRPNELQYLFGNFWNASTIQEFWSGKSFLRPDDGQPLSYELAKLLVQLLDKDYNRLVLFCTAASLLDAGERAAHDVLGVSLQELAAIVLGDGEWVPRPETWTSGAEKGQFRAAEAPA